MKKNSKSYWFWRSVLISSVIFGCAIVCAFGTAEAYEGIIKTGFAQETKAVEYNDGEVTVFGKKISFKQ